MFSDCQIPEQMPVTKGPADTALEERCRSTSVADIRAGLWSMESFSIANSSIDFSVKAAGEHLLQNLWATNLSIR